MVISRSIDGYRGRWGGLGRVLGRLSRCKKATPCIPSALPPPCDGRNGSCRLVGGTPLLPLERRRRRGPFEPGAASLALAACTRGAERPPPRCEGVGAGAVSR